MPGFLVVDQRGNGFAEVRCQAQVGLYRRRGIRAAENARLELAIEFAAKVRYLHWGGLSAEDGVTKPLGVRENRRVQITGADLLTRVRHGVGSADQVQEGHRQQGQAGTAEQCLLDVLFDKVQGSSGHDATSNSWARRQGRGAWATSIPNCSRTSAGNIF